MASERGFEFVTRTATIGEDVTQPGEAMADGPEDLRAAVAILDPGGMDDGEGQQAQRIGHDVALVLREVRHGPCG